MDVHEQMRLRSRWFSTLLQYAFAAACLVVLALALMPAADDPVHIWDKAKHALAFYGLCLLGLAAFPRVSAPLLGAAVVAFGGLIELLQALPMVHRDAEWADLLADAAGTLLALAPLMAAGVRDAVRLRR